MFPTIDKKKTGCRIKYLMVREGLKPVDIQHYLGLTCVQTVYRWIKGVNVPTVDNLYALGELFHTRVDDILAGRGKTGKFLEAKLPEDRMIAYCNRVRRLKA